MTDHTSDKVGAGCVDQTPIYGKLDVLWVLYMPRDIETYSLIVIFVSFISYNSARFSTRSTVLPTYLKLVTLFGRVGVHWLQRTFTVTYYENIVWPWCDLLRKHCVAVMWPTTETLCGRDVTYYRNIVWPSCDLLQKHCVAVMWPTTETLWTKRISLFRMSFIL
jgi:hypothetical protein